MTDAEVIQAYYDHFNARRFGDATALLAEDAHLAHQPIDMVGQGSDTYARIARRWLEAFPDLQLTIERIDQMRDEWHEVYLVGEGTHDGDFDMGPLGIAKATHRRGRMRFRHLLRVQDGRITSSTLSFDTSNLIRQIAP